MGMLDRSATVNGLASPEAWKEAATGDGPGATLQFRDFTLVPGQRVLLQGDEPVEIGSRAFDLLVLLLRSRGNVVSKRDIFHHVWPATAVEESNLRFQIACLRRALGDHRDVIKTVQGRGYMLAAGADEPAPANGSAPAGASLAGDGQPAAGPRTAVAHPAYVAIIEDDEGTREALDGLVRSFGLTPMSFATTQAFMNSASRSLARCLVLDVCLPGRSGLDFHLDMRRAGLDMPVIFISGHADVPMSVRAMKAGAVEFLTKPVRHEELMKAVNGVVAGAMIN